MNKFTQHYSIAFIGAGKVGTALGYYLKNNGFDVKGYYSRDKGHALNAANLTNTVTYNDISDAIAQNDIIFITVADDAINEVATNIASQLHQIKSTIPEKIKYSKIFIHTSGVYSSEILNSLKDEGAEICSVHPLLSINNFETAVNNLKKTYFCVDGTDKAKQIITSIFNETGNELISINPELKSLYHGAASVVSNYFVTLSNFSYQMMQKSGLDQETSKKALMPLINSTIDNIKSSKTNIDALTGPIKRKDKETVKRHIEILNKFLPEFINLYKTLGRETAIMLGEDYVSFFGDIF